MKRKTIVALAAAVILCVSIGIVVSNTAPTHSISPSGEESPVSANQNGAMEASSPEATSPEPLASNDDTSDYSSEADAETADSSSALASYLAKKYGYGPDDYEVVDDTEEILDFTRDADGTEESIAPEKRYSGYHLALVKIDGAEHLVKYSENGSRELYTSGGADNIQWHYFKTKAEKSIARTLNITAKDVGVHGGESTRQVEEKWMATGLLDCFFDGKDFISPIPQRTGNLIIVVKYSAKPNFGAIKNAIFPLIDSTDAPVNVMVSYPKKRNGNTETTFREIKNTAYEKIMAQAQDELNRKQEQ